MKVDLLPAVEALGEGSWNALLAQSAERAPFLSWQWQTAWLEAFGRGRPLYLLTVTDDAGALTGLLPLYEAAAGRYRQVGGTDVSDYLDLIAVAGLEAEVWGALLHRGLPGGVRWDLRGIRERSRTIEILPALAAPHDLAVRVEVEDRCPVLALPETWEAYLAGLSGKDRHELRRKIRRLERELPGTRVRAHAAAAGWDAALGEFLRLHRRSREGKAKFMDPRMETFFREATRGLAAQGWARLWFLEADAGPVATFLCLEWSDRVGLYNSGFEPAHARLAPGIVLLAHVIRDAIERRVPVFDFLRGEEPYKYDFGPVPEDLLAVTVEAAPAA
ncbi:MAG: GNAT family N-acetyltransferase [Candidatus Rokubacteria bacterium]|nr:GNAT family N-acetyltransferase [Candidatus Rokubacteria bacterium]